MFSCANRRPESQRSDQTQNRKSLYVKKGVFMINKCSVIVFLLVFLSGCSVSSDVFSRMGGYEVSCQEYKVLRALLKQEFGADEKKVKVTLVIRRDTSLDYLTAPVGPRYDKFIESLKNESKRKVQASTVCDFAAKNEVSYFWGDALKSMTDCVYVEEQEIQE